MTKLIEHLLRNFSMLEDITIFFGAPGLLASYAIGPALEFAHILVGYGADEFIILIMYDTLELGDKTVDFPPNFSLYEFAALQACENNHWSLAMIYSEVELVKGASIVDAYVVHKSVLVESKNTSILVSCGKFKTITRLMCILPISVAIEVLKSTLWHNRFNLQSLEKHLVQQ
uniref:Myosin head, motor region n=1 Tax=Solanum tuberosum TaxID=4113 RepID=M1ATL8_SOLTU